MQAFRMSCTFNTKSRNGGIGTQAIYFFIQGEQRDDIINSLFNWQPIVLKRVLYLG